MKITIELNAVRLLARAAVAVDKAKADFKAEKEKIKQEGEKA